MALQLDRSPFGECANSFPMERKMIGVCSPHSHVCPAYGAEGGPSQGRALELAFHRTAGLGSGITQGSVPHFIAPCRMGNNDLLLGGPQCPHSENGDSRAACGMALLGLCKQTKVSTATFITFCTGKRQLRVNFRLVCFFESPRKRWHPKVHMKDQGFGATLATE